jgi:glycosyltransferase involved in cell wall biosynthesis
VINKILLLNTDDFTGGAAIACRRLLKALRTHTDVEAKMLVQESKSGQEGVVQLNNSWFQKKKAFLRFVAERLFFLFYEKSKAVRFAFNPAKFGTDITDNKIFKESDIIHLHWTNFGFLSINSLQKIFQTNKPVVWTLHDMWAFTGGCHHSGECENYQKSCGNCVRYLKNPSEHDLSFQVLAEKSKAFQGANLTVITCSEWLRDRARKSALFQNIKVEAIPNPIDAEVFRPIDKHLARKKFGLDKNKKYILFAAMRVDAVGKGFAYFQEALSMFDARDSMFDESSNPNIESRTSNIETQTSNIEHRTPNIEILIFGQAEASDFQLLPFKVNILGRLSDLDTIAHAYSAASVFVIPSLEENLPNTIMESMACGTPVVGFEVGGIPEMIDHLKTGYLAKYKSADDLANGIQYILQESDYQSLCDNSRQKVVDNYSEKVVAEKYKKIYEFLCP